MKLYVGLDVSSTQLDLCALTDKTELPILLEATFKNDQLDAFYIADYFRINRFNVFCLKQEHYLALQHLTRSRLQ